MEAKTYNGWANYETWVVALWLDNEEGSYRLMRDLTREVWSEVPQSPAVEKWGVTREQAAVTQLADRLRDYIEEGNPVTEPTMYADLMNAAVCEVRWDEIARHYVEDFVAEEGSKES